MLREEDKRNFKRYFSGSECEITLPSGTYKGKIIDYSDGAGVIIENIKHIAQGTEVEIRSSDHYLEFRGVVAWVVNDGDHHRAGIKRIDSFKGSLRDFQLADILIGVNRSAMTGVLEVTRGGTVKKIFIDKGDMIFAASNNEDERLGEHLLKKGKITLAEFEKASELLKTTGQKLGKILVELCSLSPKELFQEVRQQIEDIIVSLFLWDDGEFEFKEGPIPSGETVTLQISTANIIYRGIKKVNNFVLVKKMCPSINDILNPSHNPLHIFQSINLDKADKKLLSYINGVYPLKTLLSLSPISNFETLKTLSALVSIGLIYVKKENEAPAELPVEEIFGEPEAAPPDYLEKIAETYNKCEYLGYYETLGIPQNALLDDIKRSYFLLLKQFHPDRHFSFHSHDVKEKLLKIVAYATEAYETLSDPDRRKEYNKTIIAKEPEKKETLTTCVVKESPETEKTDESGKINDVTEPEKVRETSAPPAMTVNDLLKGDNNNGGALSEEIKPSGESCEKETIHIELPEEIISAAVVEGPAVEETEEKAGETVPVYDLTSQEIEGSADNQRPDAVVGPDEKPETAAEESPRESLEKEPVHIEFPEEIISAAVVEGPAVEETEEKAGETVPVYDLTGQEIEGSADNQKPDAVVDPDEKPETAAEESPKESLEKEPVHIDQDEEIMSASGEEPVHLQGEESDGMEAPSGDQDQLGVIVEAEDEKSEESPSLAEGPSSESGNGGLGAVTVNNDLAEKVNADEKERDAHLFVAMVAREDGTSKKKWFYIPVVLVTIMLLAVAIPLVDKNIKEYFSQPVPDQIVKPDPQAVQNNGVQNATTPNVVQRQRLASFRDDAFSYLMGGQ